MQYTSQYFTLFFIDSMERRNKIVQEIKRNVTNVFSFYAIIAIEQGFSMH